MFDVGLGIMGVELSGFVTRMLVSINVLLLESEWSSDYIWYQMRITRWWHKNFNGKVHKLSLILLWQRACECLYFPNNFKHIPVYYIEISMT
jgi:hypothetical protein